jgi:hypothetical protein
MKLQHLPPCDSPECPLIRLYGRRAADYHELHTALRSLAESRRRAIAWHDEPWIEPVGGIRFTARLSESSAGIRALGDNEFELALRAELWGDMAALAATFLDGSSVEGGGFLWLDEAYGLAAGPGDSAIRFLLSAYANGAW